MTAGYTTDPQVPTISKFDVNRSTEEMYAQKVLEWCEDDLAMENRAQRMTLDPSYHWHYSLERQLYQDDIVEDVLAGCRYSEQQPFPWVVFTAGPMGAGKGYVVRWMETQSYFPLHHFVLVDPDEIRRNLPEWDDYVAFDPSTAGAKTQKEACLVAELCTLRALQSRLNIVIDGSLRDADWHVGYFARLRKSFPGVRIAILHVTAPIENIKANVHQRFLITGRMVPEERVLQSVEQVPRSVELLAPLTDVCCCIQNGERSGEPILRKEPKSLNPPCDVALDWDFFTSLWDVSSLYKGDDEGGDKRDSMTSSLSLSSNQLQTAVRKGIVRKTTVKSMDFLGRRRISQGEIDTALSVASIGTL